MSESIMITDGETLLSEDHLRAAMPVEYDVGYRAWQLIQLEAPIDPELIGGEGPWCIVGTRVGTASSERDAKAFLGTL